MKSVTKSVLAALCALALLSGMAFAAPIADRYDVVVAGGGMGGCGAALQAARMGASVLVVEPTYVLGGQSISGGVSTRNAVPSPATTYAPQRRRLSRGSGEVHTLHLHPICGTPTLVPVPRKRNFNFTSSSLASCRS